MADKNMEDNDIEPAPKLIQVLFQNCKGQVDQWVEPYLRATVERLRRAEKSYLKCLLIQVVGRKHKLLFISIRIVLLSALFSLAFSFWVAILNNCPHPPTDQKKGKIKSTLLLFPLYMAFLARMSLTSMLLC